jgi:transposase
MMTTVLASPKIFADDTTLPVLDPGRGRTKTGRLWCYAVDNRPWCGPGHPAAVYIYSDDRKGVHPAEHLKGYSGLVQVDGYAGFDRLVTNPAGDAPQLAFCRVGGDVTAPTPHRPGRAGFPHPVLHERALLTAV